jgi:hypothetical protein
MSNGATFFSALIVGLIGADHCAGMCSGIVGVLSMGTDKLSRPARLLRISAYNAGRIASYAMAGAVAGAVGQTLGGLLPGGLAHQLAMGVSALFAFLLAAYMMGWGSLLVRVEGAGGHLWRYLQPLGQRFIPAQGAGRTFALGLVWGWLPCGLVYTALAWSLVSGSAARGALLMLGFGLGTLPALVTMGMAGSWLLAWRSQPLVRYAAGLALIGLAAATLWQGLVPADPASGHMH